MTAPMRPWSTRSSELADEEGRKRYIFSNGRLIEIGDTPKAVSDRIILKNRFKFYRARARADVALVKKVAKSTLAAVRDRRDRRRNHINI